MAGFFCLKLSKLKLYRLTFDSAGIKIQHNQSLARHYTIVLKEKIQRQNGIILSWSNEKYAFDFVATERSGYPEFEKFLITKKAFRDIPNSRNS